MRCLLIATFVVVTSGFIAAQDDVLAKARHAAASGHRAEALRMLEERLASVPRDVDTRLLYGLVLSWEARYDDARRELEQVLAQAPTYMDARIALMNVEYWAGRSTEARSMADAILATDPGNAPARVVRERLTMRPWKADILYSVDAFSDATDPLHELAMSLERATPAGPLIVRGSHAIRSGEDDQFIEAAFYPRFRPGTYAFIGVGLATDADLYPKHRFAFDLYQSIGRGFEVSAGARYLHFGPITEIYVGTVSKYAGNWMLTGKLYHVPGAGALGSTSSYGGVRRYFGGDGTSYAGVAYSHGFGGQEIRHVVDLVKRDSDSIHGEFDRRFRAPLRLYGNASISRTRPSTQRHITVAGGFRVLF